MAALATALTLATSAAAAMPEIAAEYRLVETRQLASGLTRMRIAFTFTNVGDVAFADLAVGWIGVVPFMLAGRSDPIAVGALEIAASVTVEAAVDVVGPIDAGAPALFIGHGADTDLRVPVTATSREADQ